MRCDRDVETVIGRIMECVRLLRRVPHDLLRHTAYIYAGATQRAILDDARFCAILCRSLGMCEPTAAATNNENVVSFRHLISPVCPWLAHRTCNDLVLIC